MCEEKWSRSWSRSSEPARADSENEVSDLILSSDKSDSSEGKPSDEKTNYFLAQLREELGEIRKRIDFSDDGISLALASVCNFERHLAAQERWAQETAKSPEKDQSPQEAKSSSSSKEGEEYFLVTPIKGVSEDGRLLLGDRKILSARALKI